MDDVKSIRKYCVWWACSSYFHCAGSQANGLHKIEKINYEFIENNSEWDIPFFSIVQIKHFDTLYQLRMVWRFIIITRIHSPFTTFEIWITAMKLE